MSNSFGRGGPSDARGDSGGAGLTVKVLERAQRVLEHRIVTSKDFRGDEEIEVRSADWLECAILLKSDTELAMDHFIDLTAVDYPEREPDRPRFEVLLLLRSQKKNHRLRMKTPVRDAEELDSLCTVWAGANWAEREIFDMFGIRFRGHPDLRRILMYEEFVGHPLRKDYPIEKTQPLVPYRDEEGIHKLPPFGVDEGQPWGRIRWAQRLVEDDRQVSPAIALQTGQRPALSASEATTKTGPNGSR